MTIIDHKRTLFPEIYAAWTGPAADRMGTTNPDENTTRWEWDTDLTPEQEESFRDIIAASGAGMELAQYSTVKQEAARLRTYYLNDTPTNAQSVQAIKDLIKVVRVMWNEGD